MEELIPGVRVGGRGAAGQLCRPSILSPTWPPFPSAQAQLDKRLAQLGRVVAAICRDPASGQPPGGADQLDLELQLLLKDSAQRIADFQRDADYKRQEFDFQQRLQVSGSRPRAWPGQPSAHVAPRALPEGATQTPE